MSHIKIQHSFMIMCGPYIKIRNILIDMSKPYKVIATPKKVGETDNTVTQKSFQTFRLLL